MIDCIKTANPTIEFKGHSYIIYLNFHNKTPLDRKQERYGNEGL